VGGMRIAYLLQFSMRLNNCQQTIALTRVAPIFPLQHHHYLLSKYVVVARLSITLLLLQQASAWFISCTTIILDAQRKMIFITSVQPTM